jgi:hypothetical protein
MKKLMIIASLFIAASVTKTEAQVIITNHACEAATVVIYAEDTYPTPCGGWVSYTITINPGDTIGTNTPAWMNDPSAGCGYSGGGAPGDVGWASGPVALWPCYLLAYVPSSSPWGWDGAQVSTSGGTVTVGSSSCISSGSASTSPGYDNCSGNPMTAKWTVYPLTIVLLIKD